MKSITNDGSRTAVRVDPFTFKPTGCWLKVHRSLGTSTTRFRDSGLHPRHFVSLSVNNQRAVHLLPVEKWWAANEAQKKEKPVKVAPALKITFMFLLVDSVGCLFCNRKTNSQQYSSPNYHRGSKGNQNSTNPPRTDDSVKQHQGQAENQPFAVCDHRFKATGFQQNNHFCPISLTCRHTGISVWLHLKVICDCTHQRLINYRICTRAAGFIWRSGAEETRRVTMILIQGQLLVLKTTESAALKWGRKSLSLAGCELKSRRPAWSPTLCL